MLSYFSDDRRRCNFGGADFRYSPDYKYQKNCIQGGVNVSLRGLTVVLEKEICRGNTFQLTELLEMNHGNFLEEGQKHGREQAGQLTITYHHNKRERSIEV